MDSTTRGLLMVLAALVVVALAVSALTGGMMGPGLAGQGPFGAGIMLGHWWMWGLGMGLGGLAMLLLWGVLIVGLVLLARAVGLGRGPHSAPLDVLKRRYTAGQITREEYEQIRKDLEQ
jgi:putative membrane protein